MIMLLLILHARTQKGDAYVLANTQHDNAAANSSIMMNLQGTYNQMLNVRILSYTNVRQTSDVCVHLFVHGLYTAYVITDVLCI